jgi:hypothetical protein
LLNTIGDQNVAVGGASTDANTTGIRLTAIGFESLTANTTGNNNTALGHSALAAVTDGDDNTSVGYNSGTAITTGSKNSILGVGAGNQITTASGNTAIGFDALTRCTIGGSNVCVGFEAGDNITTGSNNVCVGLDSGTNITQGDNNVCVGNDAKPAAETSTFEIVLGVGFNGVGSNSFSFGKASNVVSNDFDANATFTRNSDLHKKTNIKDTDLGLSFINELRPVTFNWKPNSEFPKHYKDYSETENSMDTETSLYGMIAQDVEKALDKVGHKNFGGWSEEEDGSQRLAQSMFIYPLINAVKELSAQVEELKAKLNEGE